jgi:aminoglycoside 2''-phosphotransferase
MAPTSNQPKFLSGFTLDQIREGLQQAFPNLRPELGQLKLLNDGFSSYVVLVGDELILRIAKHAEAMIGHLKEQSILPLLQKHLPVQIPQPSWRVGPSDFFPFGVMGYRRITGVPFSLRLVPKVELNRIAQDVARFLVALHHVPVGEMVALDLREADKPERLRTEVMPTLHAHLTADEYERIAMWWESLLNHPVKNSFTPRLLHGDPWGENIILNETLDSVVGVVDFEAVSVGDVARDFAAQKYLGSGFLNQVIEQYQVLGGELESHFAVRLRDWSLLRELAGLRYAIQYPVSEELTDSLRKVRYELSLFA